jgi:Condensation domain/TubC N-terminal docking domain
MNSEEPGSLATTIRSLGEKGVRFWSANGRLHFTAPKGVLTEAEIEALRSSRGKILALVERPNNAEADSTCHRTVCSPLAFSQLAHWRLYNLGIRPAIRQVAAVTRLDGPLDAQALQSAIEVVIRRHDALRTRIDCLHDEPFQEVLESREYELELEDLSSLPNAECEDATLRCIQGHILEPIDLAKDPLFGLKLLRLGIRKHVLIVALEHSISDGVSLGIFLSDLLTAYGQVLSGRPVSLPVIPVQFVDYALRQRRTAALWADEHGPYWREHFAGCGRLRFPSEKSARKEARSSWGIVPVRIDAALVTRLKVWSRARRTTIVMSMFAVYVALMFRWCDTVDGVVRYQSDGRWDPDIKNTMGFFATVLYLKLHLEPTDSLITFMGQVTEEYCRAHEHADYGYMSIQSMEPEFIRNSAFNWLPRSFGSASSGAGVLDGGVVCSPVPFVHPMAQVFEIDREPFILLSENDAGEIMGDVWFPRKRLSAETMERFAHDLRLFVEVLIGKPDTRIKDIVLEA